MAFSENIFEHAAVRQSFSDTWISEAFARETEAVTKALQKSMSQETEHHPNSALLSFNDIKPETTFASGSDHETGPKRPRNPIPSAVAGKITKRKSRASKRSPTTFITADPSNFRQMVQQVTGIRFVNSHVPVSPVLKPEPQRPANRMQMCMPTLDTSAFLLDLHHHQGVGAAGPQANPTQVSYAPECAGLEFETTFPTFPTLESWGVM